MEEEEEPRAARRASLSMDCGKSCSAVGSLHRGVSLPKRVSVRFVMPRIELVGSIGASRMLQPAAMERRLGSKTRRSVCRVK